MVEDAATIGRYRLVGELGRGGMGEVHLAAVTGPAGFEKHVALKVIGRRFANDLARNETLLREALIGVQLDHANIVQILDFGDDDGRYYVVMDYVRGFSLSHVIDYGETTGTYTPIASAVHAARAVAGALSYVHNLPGAGDGPPPKLIHGDITPTNVLLGGDGRIKLSDFGVAALSRELAGADRVAGKLRYLPPEAFRGDEPTQGWDVYSLGCTLYEALALRPAFEGKDGATVKESQADGAERLDAIRDDVPAALADVVHRAIDPKPFLRFGSAIDFRVALDEAWPPRVDDEQTHRDFVAGVYADDRFVERFGGLPTTAGLATPPPAPHVSQREDPTAAMPRKPPLRMGLSPALGADAARDIGDRLATALRDRLGRTIRTNVYADYEAMVQCLRHGEVDLAWMPPIPFVEAADYSAGILVSAVRNGRTSYESALIARADADLARVDDLRGASAAWVDRDSAGGYMFAAALIRERLGDPDEVLGRQHFHGSHRAVCEAVANGWADVGATYAVRRGNDIISAAWLDTLDDRASELAPIAFVGPIPSDCIAHRPHLPQRLRRELIDALTSLSDDDDGRTLLADAFNAEAFVRGKLDTYEAVRRLVLASRK